MTSKSLKAERAVDRNICTLLLDSCWTMRCPYVQPGPILVKTTRNMHTLTLHLRLARSICFPNDFACCEALKMVVSVNRIV